MSYNSRFFRGLVLSLTICVLAVGTFADTIRLKDGSIIKGRIVGFGGGKFTVAIGEGSRRRDLTFTANDVESVVFESSDRQHTSATGNQNASFKDVPPQAKPAAPPKKPETAAVPPIEWRLKVLADNTANGWTNTGWVVKKGQTIRISGDGKVSLGRGQNSPPSGIATLNDERKLLPNVATGSLVAVIGDDNNDFIHIGSKREFIATRDGSLFLGINEGNLEDNSGSFNVKVEIIPDEVR